MTKIRMTKCPYVLCSCRKYKKMILNIFVVLMALHFKFCLKKKTVLKVYINF